MQSRRRPHHGNVSPSRRRCFHTRCWFTARLPQRRRLSPHHHRDRARAHPDPLSRRSLHRDLGPDTWWPTPEPPHRINQIYLEPILFAHAEAMASCTILNRTRVVGFNQTEASVLVQAEALDGGETIEIRCDYLVGCEGGRSETRLAIGAKLLGDAEIGRVQSTLIRAPSLLGNLKAKPAWGTFSLNTRLAAATDLRESTAVRRGARSSQQLSPPRRARF